MVTRKLGLGDDLGIGLLFMTDFVFLCELL
jgi:hypothetical protein